MTGQKFEDNLAASYAHGASVVSAEQRARPLRTFLFGYPIAYSLAPALHASMFKGLEVPWTYELHETQDFSELVPALKQPDVVGCAVTMPYKVTAMSVVDQVTDEARSIGAINTIFLRKAPDGTTQYIGTNTDCIGVRDALLQNFSGILDKSTGRPALVIGGGGAARSAVYALGRWFGVSKIYMVNRLKSEVETIATSFKANKFDIEIVWVGSEQQARDLESPAIIVGTVPDIPAQEEGEILAKKLGTVFLEKPEKGHILEMCYHPNPATSFYREAVNHGWDVIMGTESMIYQGVAQQALWAEIPSDRFKLEESKRLILDILMKHH